ncbi:uncharacterized protein LOC132186131 [Corylus avellana]|uniref:uncharacterized protein LOC132186130 n=1 Tax=Corylus avellana TaxID=13451 RepID=UPI00286B5229|nr:uncharacterized protein LOC132186130 [Corylus avellana]XP_059455939.1 uncharacterized protein LOC132186131 [Corylus avellana]
MRRVIVMMTVLIMLVLVVAQANADSRCTANCGPGCLSEKKSSNLLYLLCSDLCTLKCIKSPTDSVYSCTSDCAHSIRIFSEEDKGGDKLAAYVKDYVEDCYNNCNKKNN